MLKLIKDNKTKTFYTEMNINHFLGVYKPDIRNEQICESTYIKMCEKYKTKMLWDDCTEMTPSEWVLCAKAIYKELGT